MSKYSPLSAFLQGSSADAVKLSFSDVEDIVGFRLPGSAYRYQAWWSNNPSGHSHSLAWVRAGWQSEQVDVPGRKVTFRRGKTEPAAAGQAAGGEHPPSLFGALRGTVRFAPDFDATEPTGEVWEAQEGRL